VTPPLPDNLPVKVTRDVDHRRPAVVLGGRDCNDLNPYVFPGAAEFCDFLDNDCDGVVDNVPNVDCPKPTPIPITVPVPNPIANPVPVPVPVPVYHAPDVSIHIIHEVNLENAAAGLVFGLWSVLVAVLVMLLL